MQTMLHAFAIIIAFLGTLASILLSVRTTLGSFDGTSPYREFSGRWFDDLVDEATLRIQDYRANLRTLRAGLLLAAALSAGLGAGVSGLLPFSLELIGGFLFLALAVPWYVDWQFRNDLVILLEIERERHERGKSWGDAGEHLKKRFPQLRSRISNAQKVRDYTEAREAKIRRDVRSLHAQIFRPIAAADSIAEGSA